MLYANWKDEGINNKLRHVAMKAHANPDVWYRRVLTEFRLAHGGGGPKRRRL